MTETYYKINGFPVSAALMTDTHGADPEPILKSLRSHAPSLIALAGDFIHGLKPQPGVRIGGSQNVINLLTGCVGLASTLVSLGNHEAYLSLEDMELIHSTGVTLLDNTYVTQELGGNRLVIGGLSSGYLTAWQRYKAKERDARSPAPDTGWLEGFAAADGYHILLMHHPEYIHLIPPSIELALSGHAHGGQWRFYDPRTKAWRGVYAPDQGLFPKLTADVVDGRLVISRGLGNTTRLPRIHNDTEIVYIDGG